MIGLRRMLSKELPLKLDLTRLFKQAKQLEEVLLCGTIQVSKLTSLKDFLAELSGTVQVELRFKVDGHGISYIEGRLQASLPLICERCLSSMGYPLDRAFLLSPIEDIKQASALPEQYEPILLSEGMMSVPECIAEEILLSLPLTPKHEALDCNQDLIAYITPPEVIEARRQAEKEETKKRNPFGLLKDLVKAH